MNAIEHFDHGMELAYCSNTASTCFNALAAVRRARKEGVAIVNIATLNDPGAESVLRYVVSDEELEAAAEESALSYTFQTSQYNLCCH
jgi:hypothetical protein